MNIKKKKKKRENNQFLSFYFKISKYLINSNNLK